MLRADLVLRLALAAVGLSGCIVPYALPPLKGELGASRIGDAPVVHAAAGTHLASATMDRDQPFDLGVGGFLDWNHTSPSAGDGMVNTATAAGAYVDGSVFVERNQSTRTSIGLRGELRYANTQSTWDRGYGGKLRIEHEYFSPTRSSYSGDGRCSAMVGGLHGTGAIGLFAEAGRVTNPDRETSAWTATVGVTLRVPTTAGVILAIPGCR